MQHNVIDLINEGSGFKRGMKEILREDEDEEREHRAEDDHEDGCGDGFTEGDNEEANEEGNGDGSLRRQQLRSERSTYEQNFEPEIKLTIPSGYIFRSLLDYLSKKSSLTNWFFDKNGFEINAHNDQITIGNVATFFKDQLLDYNIVPATARAVYFLPADSILKSIKSMKKGYSLVIQKKRNKKELTFSAITESGVSNNFIHRIESPDALEFFSPTDYGPLKPIKIKNTNFCSQLHNVRSYDIITFRRTNSGLVLSSNNEQDRSVLINLTQGSNEELNHEDEDNFVEVAHQNIDSIHKLHNLMPESVAELYIAPGLPLRCVFCIGSFGCLDVYILNRVDD